MMAMPAMPHAGEWTVDDLHELPDDGLQYELADGILLVTPALFAVQVSPARVLA